MITRRDFLGSAASAAAAGIAALTSPEGLLAQAREKAKPLHLKITDLKTFIVNRGGPNASNYVFVKIYTSQGLTGLGEGSVTSKEATVAAAIDEHKRYLVGKDAADIEMHWQAMYRWPRWRNGPILNSAISAVEIALWDIVGQGLGQPIYKLIGGKARERVQMYVHAGGNSPQQYAQTWLQAKQEGWTGCKAAFITTQGDVIYPVRSVREGIANLKAVREAVGEDFRICIDVHGKTTPTMAIDFCRRAEEYSPYFVEEATQIEDLDELALLRSKTRIPLATGERLTTKYGFNQICHRHLVDYVQPDVVHCGGILEMKKIATIAEAYRIELAPHNPQSDVSTLASLQVDFSTPNFAIQEITHRGNEQYWKDLFYGGGITYEKGFALPPDRPGLGVNLDEAVAAKRPYQPHTRQQLRFPDGSIADH
ncbi:MAG TPA: galactonate dehydratase [Bryobacteraceae bacterium]|nr:galactonate dehydratase [Bryobacteraceae bacterium]